MTIHIRQSTGSSATGLFCLSLFSIFVSTRGAHVEEVKGAEGHSRGGLNAVFITRLYLSLSFSFSACSWGRTWGEQGYIRIEQGQHIFILDFCCCCANNAFFSSSLVAGMDLCEIANDVSFPKF